MCVVSTRAMLLCTMCRDLQASGRASLVVTEGGFRSMNDARCTLTGSFREITDTESIAAARDTYMERHPDAFWVDFGDFSFLRMDELLQVNFIGGFGRISAVRLRVLWCQLRVLCCRLTFVCLLGRMHTPDWSTTWLRTASVRE